METLAQFGRATGLKPVGHWFKSNTFLLFFHSRAYERRSKMGVKEVITISKQFVVKNAPTIMTAIGGVGFVATIFETADRAPKAKAALNKAAFPEEGYPPKELSMRDKAKIVAPIVWPVAALGVFSLSCFIFANHISLTRTAAALAAYQLSENSLKSLKEAAIKTVGEKKTEEIFDTADADKVRAKQPGEGAIIITGGGDQLCYDSLSGRYFKSTIEKIRQAENDINYRLNREDSVSLNEFYDLLSLDPIDIGDRLGWNLRDKTDLLDIRFSSTISKDGEAVLVMSYDVVPTFWYGE